MDDSLRLWFASGDVPGDCYLTEQQLRDENARAARAAHDRREPLQSCQRNRFARARQQVVGPGQEHAGATGGTPGGAQRRSTALWARGR